MLPKCFPSVNTYISVPDIYISVFLPVPNYFDYCSFLLSFEIKNCHSSHFELLFLDCFDYLKSLEIHMNFKMNFSFSAKKKKIVGILIGIFMSIIPCEL